MKFYSNLGQIKVAIENNVQMLFQFYGITRILVAVVFSFRTIGGVIIGVAGSILSASERL